VEEVLIPNFARNVFTLTYCDVDFNNQGRYFPEFLQNVEKRAATLPHVFSDDGKPR
jgi:hypothetical protein